jgi:hypothetical protein
MIMSNINISGMLSITEIDDYIIVTGIYDHIQYVETYNKQSNMDLIKDLIEAINNKSENITYTTNIDILSFTITVKYLFLNKKKSIFINLSKSSVIFKNKIKNLITENTILRANIIKLEKEIKKEKTIELYSIMEQIFGKEKIEYNCGKEDVAYYKRILNMIIIEIGKYNIIIGSDILIIILTYISCAWHYHLVSIENLDYYAINDEKYLEIIFNGKAKFIIDETYYTEYIVSDTYYCGEETIILKKQSGVTIHLTNKRHYSIDLNKYIKKPC